MFWRLIGYAAIPIAAMCLSGFAAARRPPEPALRSAVLHLAAGVIFAVVAVEFLPDLMREHDVPETVLGFVAGTVAMLGIRWLVRRGESQSEEQDENTGSLPVVLLVATAVDVAIDGILLGTAFAAGRSEGRLLAIALAIEFTSLGLATAMTMARHGSGPGRALLTVCGLAVIFGVAAVPGGLLLQGAHGRTLAILLAFGSAALLFMVTEELLTEAHEIPESPWFTAAFFLGYIVLFLIEMLSR